MNSNSAKLSPARTTAQSREAIRLLTHGDLVKRIVAAGLPFLRETDHQRLPSLDRETLERLLYLADDYIRNKRVGTVT